MDDGSPLRSLHRTSDGVQERSFDGPADASRFLRVEDDRTFGAALLEVPVEQAPENVGSNGCLSGPEKANGKEASDRACGES